MRTEDDIQRALGRHRASWLAWALPTAVAALAVFSCVVAVAKGHAYAGTFIRTGVWVMTAILIWIIPGTVITRAGHRASSGRGRS